MLDLKIILFSILTAHFITAEDLKNCNVVPPDCIRENITYGQTGNYGNIFTLNYNAFVAFCRNLQYTE